MRSRRLKRWFGVGVLALLLLLAGAWALHRPIVRELVRSRSPMFIVWACSSGRLTGLPASELESLGWFRLKNPLTDWPPMSPTDRFGNPWNVAYRVPYNTLMLYPEVAVYLSVDPSGKIIDSDARVFNP